jgi:hypothetical protein
MRNPELDSESLAQYEKRLTSARKAYAWNILRAFPIAFLIALGTRAIINGSLTIPIDGKLVLLTVGTTVLSAGAGLIVTFWRDMPCNIVYDIYKDFRHRTPELSGFFHWRLWALAEQIRYEINKLAADGVRWDVGDRFAVATSLLEGSESVNTYYATSTDPPYDKLRTYEQFYRMAETKLRGATVRRLLVFPPETLWKELESKDDFRQNLEEFVRLHQKREFVPSQFVRTLRHYFTDWITKRLKGRELELQSRWRWGYELRYWPKTTEALRDEMRRYFKISDADGDDRRPVLVDVAVIDDRLVFGQVGLATDVTSVSGPGMVRGGQLAAMKYKSCFEHLWQHLESDCFSAAQLELYAKLFELRVKNVREFKKPGGPSTGEAFYRSVVTKLAAAKNLRAVDIADDTEGWFAQDEYKDFHNAMITSAKANPDGEHARIFVLPRRLRPLVNDLFLEKVVKELLDGGVHVYIYLRGDLLKQDFAASDYIITDDWGFYLAPGESFKLHSLDESRNSLVKEDVDGIFRGWFERLKTNAPISLRTLKDFNSDELGRRLTT